MKDDAVSKEPLVTEPGTPEEDPNYCLVDVSHCDTEMKDISDNVVVDPCRDSENNHGRSWVTMMPVILPAWIHISRHLLLENFLNSYLRNCSSNMPSLVVCWLYII